MNVLGICGSLQAASSNLSLLQRAAELAPPGMRFSIYDGIRHLPLFNPDLEGEGVPAPVASFRSSLKACDALLVASPEYGHSLPGALKNAIDWVIGSGELYQKLVAVTASAPSPARGERGLKALCITLNAVNARILGGDPLVRGPSFDEELSVLLEVLMQMRGVSTDAR